MKNSWNYINNYAHNQSRYILVVACLMLLLSLISNDVTLWNVLFHSILFIYICICVDIYFSTILHVLMLEGILYSTIFVFLLLICNNVYVYVIICLYNVYMYMQ